MVYLHVKLLLAVEYMLYEKISMEIERIKYLLSELSVDLTLYSQLYGLEEAVEVLNQFNGLVFGRLQHCLIERIFIEFAKLMDKGRMGKNENLSLEYIIKKNNLENDQAVSDRYDEIKDMYKKTNIKNYRNKLLSHNDVKSRLESVKIKVSITPNEAHELLKSIHGLINEIEIKLGLSSFRVENDTYMIFPSGKSGTSFINKLSKCV